MSAADNLSAEGRKPGKASAKPSKPVVYKEAGLRALLKRRGKIILSVVGVLLLLILWLGFQPIKGTVHVGICRSILELQVRYPNTIKITSVEWFANSLRLYFMHIDDFGETRSEMFECMFRPDLTLADLKRNRRSLPQEEVKAINMTIPFIAAQNPDRTIPPKPKDDLLSLKRDY